MEQLSKCKKGIKYIIKEIRGSKQTRTHLGNIGLEVEDNITIISKIAATFVINVKDGRFGIDEGFAKLLMVEEL